MLGLLLLSLTIVVACSGSNVTRPAQPVTGAETRGIEQTAETPVPGNGLEPLGRRLAESEQEGFAELLDDKQEMFASSIDLGGQSLSDVVDWEQAYGLTIEDGRTDRASSYSATGENNFAIFQPEHYSLQLDSYGLIGAVTIEPIQGTDGDAIGMMYVHEAVAEEGDLPAGMYLIVQVIPSLEDPPPDTPEAAELMLIHEDGSNFAAEDLIFVDRGELGLEDEENAFQFTVGSHRCHVCPSWYPWGCICYNCPHW